MQIIVLKLFTMILPNLDRIIIIIIKVNK